MVPKSVKKGSVEAVAEAVEGETVDTALWVVEEGSSSRFALKLLQYLQQEDLLKTWISCNRSCFALANICKVPSARKAALAALKPFKKEIDANAASHAGGKVLFESMI